jgi:hypothetical protein
MERLNKKGFSRIGEDVKKKLCFLSEVALRAVKRRLASSLTIF